MPIGRQRHEIIGEIVDAEAVGKTGLRPEFHGRGTKTNNWRPATAEMSRTPTIGATMVFKMKMAEVGTKPFQHRWHRSALSHVGIYNVKADWPVLPLSEPMNVTKPS